MVIDNKKQLASTMFKWLDERNFKYNVDIFKSDPLHGRYHIEFENHKEEMMARLRWGII